LATYPSPFFFITKETPLPSLRGRVLRGMFGPADATAVVLQAGPGLRPLPARAPSRPAFVVILQKKIKNVIYWISFDVVAPINLVLEINRFPSSWCCFRRN
jgi:hypothetical protein